jgi:hypothetical protein
MAVKIKLIRSIEYLQAKTNGEIDIDRSKEILEDITNMQNQPHDYDILLDFRRSQLNLTTLDVYQLASAVSKTKDIYKYKIAILVFPGLDFDTAEFFEICSRNRFLQVEVFTNYEDAIHWFYKSKK